MTSRVARSGVVRAWSAGPRGEAASGARSLAIVLCVQSHVTNLGGDGTSGEVEHVHAAVNDRIEGQIGLPKASASMAEVVNRHGSQQGMQAVAEIPGAPSIQLSLACFPLDRSTSCRQPPDSGKNIGTFRRYARYSSPNSSTIRFSSLRASST